MGQQMSISVAAESAINMLDKTKFPENHPKIDMQQKQQEIPPECPMHQKGNTTAPPKKEEIVYASECPIQGNDVNPLNMMPPANQQPSPGQPFPLPTNRQTSSIPRAVPSMIKL